MPKIVNSINFLKNGSFWSNSVTRQVNFNRTKIGGKCQNWKIKMRHFGWFSNPVMLSQWATNINEGQKGLCPDFCTVQLWPLKMYGILYWSGRRMTLSSYSRCRKSFRRRLLHSLRVRATSSLSGSKLESPKNKTEKLHRAITRFA